jgi:beta-glucanase (GH16 family)
MKFQQTFLCIMVVLAFGRSYGQSTSKTDTLFFEDFNERTLDRSKWNVEITGSTVNHEQQAYVDSTATIHLVHGKAALGASNGALVIEAVYRAGYKSNQQKQYDFLSGRINTRNKVEFTYGTVSARIKLPKGAGLWPAFWVLGNGKWPDCGEIDIMENIGNADWTSAAIHGPGYFGNTPIIKRAVFDSNNDITHWHVYAVDWTPDSMIFKIDGKAFYTVTRQMIEHYGPWAFSNNKFVILNMALGGDYPAKVNNTTQPYNGIPQTTVDQIKAGKAKMLVDWVLVTQTK